MLSYMDEPNGSVTFLLRRSDYTWRNGQYEPQPIISDGDIVLGQLNLDHCGDISDAEVIIDEICRRLEYNKSVRSRRLQVEEMDRLNALMRKWVLDDVEYIDALCDEILKALQLQPPEDTSDETREDR